MKSLITAVLLTMSLAANADTRTEEKKLGKPASNYSETLGTSIFMCSEINFMGDYQAYVDIPYNECSPHSSGRRVNLKAHWEYQDSHQENYTGTCYKKEARKWPAKGHDTVSYACTQTRTVYTNPGPMTIYWVSTNNAYYEIRGKVTPIKYAKYIARLYGGKRKQCNPAGCIESDAKVVIKTFDLKAEDMGSWEIPSDIFTTYDEVWLEATMWVDGSYYYR